jgi:hypothetical protein
MLTWMRIDCENQFSIIIIFILGELDWCSGKIYIWFSKSMCSFMLLHYYLQLLVVFFFSILCFSISCEHSKEDLALISNIDFKIVHCDEKLLHNRKLHHKMMKSFQCNFKHGEFFNKRRHFVIILLTWCYCFSPLAITFLAWRRK